MPSKPRKTKAAAVKAKDAKKAPAPQPDEKPAPSLLATIRRWLEQDA